MPLPTRRHSTIIVIPHNRGKVYKLQISPVAVKVAIAVAIVTGILTAISLFASGTFLQQRAAYSSLQRENRLLKRSNQRLSESVNQIQSRLAQFEQRTKTLAIAAGVPTLFAGSSEDTRGAVGGGGPLHRLSAEPQDLLDRQQQLDRQLERVEQKLTHEAIMISHTPVLAPVVGVITEGYGPRFDPISHQPAFHDGLDISAALGTEVRVPADGVVIFADRETGYGKLVKVNHGYGFTTLYAHLERFLVKEGQKVTRGQVVGRVGLTGRTTGAHLHYEVWKDGEKQNPLNFILDAF
ncbi:MAG: M23 family metallopeptidase [Acidobacteria bacterium]|nr:M23 family metallopeptidase [Acidobacteriota bacterium]